MTAVKSGGCDVSIVGTADGPGPAHRRRTGGGAAAAGSCCLRHPPAPLRAGVPGRSRRNPAVLRLLCLLSDGRARTFREISAVLNLEQSTVNRQVNGAARAALVQITEGSPARLVVATDQGLAAFEADVDRVLTGYREVLEQMGEERAAALTDLLGEFIDTYQELVQPDDAG